MTERSVRPAPVTVRRGATLALASLGAFLTSLDVVVVATALPALREDLGASLADLEWNINAYNLAFAALMLTCAAVGDRIGRRTTYVAGLVLFAASSAAAALAGSTEVLIAARVIQGVGAAMILPLTLSLISDAFPKEKRGTAIGIWGAVTGLGVAAGPVLGGAIVEGLSWQWIFWINVPIALLVAVGSVVLLTETHGPRDRLDPLGLVLVSLGLTGVVWAAVRAPDAGWHSAEVLTTLVAGLVLLGAFLAWERRTAHPMLPIGYFARPGFTQANLVAFFQFVSLLGSLFMMTQLFQIGLGYSPLQAGVRILAWMAMPMLVAPIAGALADRFGNRPFMALGLLLQGSGLVWVSAVVEPGVRYGVLVVPLIISGIGVAMCFPTVANAVVNAVPVDDSGVAAAVNTSLRELGGVLGIALAAALFATNGSYATPATFITGFATAERTLGLVPLLGLVAAVLSPAPRTRPRANGARGVSA
ncbi:MFS transporter [Kribbella sp.]|uniref:MFS transporter n=1 Tax=Kribbella sp. TaxID=1871183 RepID=UPI002D2FCC3D|nr:MFS transporter [Kribbella sp.]HZX03216.1 MFS transporter [Kribbella sp.]